MKFRYRFLLVAAVLFGFAFFTVHRFNYPSEWWWTIVSLLFLLIGIPVVAPDFYLHVPQISIRRSIYRRSCSSAHQVDFYDRIVKPKYYFLKSGFWSKQQKRNGASPLFDTNFGIAFSAWYSFYITSPKRRNPIGGIIRQYPDIIDFCLMLELVKESYDADSDFVNDLKMLDEEIRKSEFFDERLEFARYRNNEQYLEVVKRFATLSISGESHPDGRTSLSATDNEVATASWRASESQNGDPIDKGSNRVGQESPRFEQFRKRLNRYGNVGTAILKFVEECLQDDRMQMRLQDDVIRLENKYLMTLGSLFLTLSFYRLHRVEEIVSIFYSPNDLSDVPARDKARTLKYSASLTELNKKRAAQHQLEIEKWLSPRN